MNVLESFFHKFSELRKDVKTEFFVRCRIIKFLIKLKENKNKCIKEKKIRIFPIKITKKILLSTIQRLQYSLTNKHILQTYTIIDKQADQL